MTYTIPSDTFKRAKQCLEDSERWFGDTLPHDDTLRLMVHHSLAMCGEAGEVANIVKKYDNGKHSMSDADVRAHLCEELDDVYTYLLNLAGILNHDLEFGYDKKRAINEARFSALRIERENGF